MYTTGPHTLKHTLGSTFYYLGCIVRTLLPFESLSFFHYLEFFFHIHEHHVGWCKFCFNHQTWFKRFLRTLFYISPYFLPMMMFFILLWIYSMSFVVISFCLDLFPRHPLHVGWSATMSLNSPSAKNVLISISSLEDVLTRYRIHDWQSPSFRTGKLHFPLASMLSDENSVGLWTGVPM